MLSWCLKCRKNTKIKNPKVAKTKKGKTMLLSKCGVRDRDLWKIEIYKGVRSKRTVTYDW